MLSSVCVFIQRLTEEQVRTPTLSSSKQPLASPAILMFKMAPTPTTLLQALYSVKWTAWTLTATSTARRLCCQTILVSFQSRERRFLWSEQASCSISYTLSCDIQVYFSKGNGNDMTGSFLCCYAKTLLNSCAPPVRELAFSFEFDF